MRDDEKTDCARHLRRNMTPSERLLWWKLRGKQQGGWKFHSQKPVGPFIIDFGRLEIQLAIEVDGATHSTAEERDYDARRARWLEESGWRVIRFSNNDIKQNLRGVVDSIHMTANDRAMRLQTVGILNAGVLRPTTRPTINLVMHFQAQADSASVHAAREGRMAALMGALSLPILILNMLGGLAGGIWLAIMGRWDLVIAGVAYAMLGPFAASIALMPSLICLGPMHWAAERNNFIVLAFFAPLNLLWTYGVMLASAVFVFTYATHNLSYSDPPWPFVLLAYGAAVSPWAFLAQKDLQAGNDNAGVPLFFLQIGCICMGMRVALGGETDWETLAIWCAVPLALGLLTQLIFMVTLSRKRAY